MEDNNKILEAIEQAERRTVIDLAVEFDVGDLYSESANRDEPLKELQDHIISVLKQTGDDIFDDESQWHTYQNAIAALVLADRELSPDWSRRLTDDAIEKPAPGNYNPLGELDELDEPTVEQLGERYKVGEVLSIDEDNPAYNRLQQVLGMALLNISPARVPGRHNVEQHLLAAMVCVDKHYQTKTILEVDPVTRTTTGINGDPLEYETKEMGFAHETDVDEGAFDNV